MSSWGFVPFWGHTLTSHPLATSLACLALLFSFFLPAPPPILPLAGLLQREEAGSRAAGG